MMYINIKGDTKAVYEYIKINTGVYVVSKAEEHWKLYKNGGI